MAGKIQGADLKTEAQLISLGGSASDLPNDTQIWVTANSINKTLDDAITDGDIGSGGGGFFVVTATESIGAGGTITTTTTDGFQFRRVQGSGAARITANAPFGVTGGWPSGTVVRLMGKSDSNTLTIPYADVAKGALVNGDAVLQNGFILELQYLSTEDRWFEVSRNF